MFWLWAVLWFAIWATLTTWCTTAKRCAVLVGVTSGAYANLFLYYSLRGTKMWHGAPSLFSVMVYAAAILLGFAAAEANARGYLKRDDAERSRYAFASVSLSLAGFAFATLTGILPDGPDDCTPEPFPSSC